MGKLFLGLALFLIVSASIAVSAFSPQDFRNIVLSDNRGTIEDAFSSGHVTYAIGKGWNLVPLAFIQEAAGRYWSNHKEGQSCNQDIFQNVWYYSSTTNDYYHLPYIDDWGSPVTRNNAFLLNDFRAKYYSIYAGSGWIYSPENCILEGDSGGELISDSYGGQAGGYQYKELTLKAGWNFVPIEPRMVYYEKTWKGVLEACGGDRIYHYDQPKNKWIDLTKNTEVLDRKFMPGDIFNTYLIKTTRDCALAEYSSSGSAPPSLP